MKRPLLAIALCYITGVIFGRYLPDGDGSIVLFIALLLAASVALYIRYRRVAYAALPFAALLGFFLVTLSVSPKSAEFERLAENRETAVVTGVVEEAHTTVSGKQSALVKAGSIRLAIVIDGSSKVSTGDYIRFATEIQKLDGVRNPGGFDEFLFYRSRKVDYKAYPDELEVIGRRVNGGVVLSWIQDFTSSRIDSLMPPAEAGIMKSLVIGDKSGIDRGDADMYRELGVYHILAVSGLHVGILAAVLNAVFKFFLKKRHAAIVTIVLLFIYALATGAGVAAMRAFIMFAAASVGSVLYRDTDSVSLTALSALILLLYEPLYLWDIGFQYSFGCVLAILLLSPKIEALIKERFARLKNKAVRQFLAVTFAATLASCPITMYHFGSLPLISIAANLVIVPSCTIVVVCGFVIVILSVFGTVIAAPLAFACTVTLKFYSLLGSILTAVPFANIVTGRPLLAMVFVFFALLLMFVLVKNKKILIASCAAFAAASIAVAMIPRGFSITMLDVGQGDCTVVEYNSKVFVFDGGGHILSGIGNNTGERVLYPYLSYRGFDTVEAVFLSHIDADHAIGIVELLDRVRVKTVFLAEGTVGDSWLYGLLLEGAKRNGSEIVYIKGGDELSFSNSLTMSCLFPDYAGGDSNEQSMVIKLSYGELDVLFTGDVPAKVERNLLPLGDTLDCEILKLAHHGSKYSNTQEFIDAVSPVFGIVGTGRNNTYGHPAPVVVERLESSGVGLYNTADCGAVIIKYDNAVLSVETMVK